MSDMPMATSCLPQTTSNMQQLRVGGWVGGKRLANVSLLSFTAPFLQQQKKVAEIPDSA
jgi:hypothetical protein